MNVYFEDRGYTLREIVREVWDQAKANTVRWAKHTFGPRWELAEQIGCGHEFNEHARIIRIYWHYVYKDRWGRKRYEQQWVDTPYGREVKEEAYWKENPPKDFSGLVHREIRRNLFSQARALNRLTWGTPTVEDLYLKEHEGEIPAYEDSCI